MKTVAIIPARMGSTRLPGKPLASICGTPMIGRVYQGVVGSNLVDAVYIATCDQVIMDYADSINASCVMTSEAHDRCTDRTVEALMKIEALLDEKFECVVMVQGDEPMVTGKMVDDAVRAMQDDAEINVVNLMSRIQSIEEFEDPNEVKVVVNKNNDALYFSREPIPSRKKGGENFPMYKQVCVIPFKREYLLKFGHMEETLLEKVESIDMMRILENDDKVRMILADNSTFSVDTQNDLEKVNVLFERNCSEYENSN